MSGSCIIHCIKIIKNISLDKAYNLSPSHNLIKKKADMYITNSLTILLNASTKISE